MDASYKIQRGIHVHLIQFFMCPEFWVHIRRRFVFMFFFVFLYSFRMASSAEILTALFAG